MATLAEMGVPPAVPLSNVTAELAFELYELGAMLGAVLDACSNTVS
jgi:hypothetical protein